MARLIVHTAKGPYIHRLPSGEVVAICMCGLSDKYPFCSGKHKLVQDEDANKVYTRMMNPATRDWVRSTLT